MDEDMWQLIHWSMWCHIYERERKMGEWVRRIWRWRLDSLLQNRFWYLLSWTIHNSIQHTDGYCFLSFALIILHRLECQSHAVRWKCHVLELSVGHNSFCPVPYLIWTVSFWSLQGSFSAALRSHNRRWHAADFAPLYWIFINASTASHLMVHSAVCYDKNEWWDESRWNGENNIEHTPCETLLVKLFVSL